MGIRNLKEALFRIGERHVIYDAEMSEEDEKCCTICGGLYYEKLTERGYGKNNSLWFNRIKILWPIGTRIKRRY
jgi:hypothetical protein